MKKSKGHFSGPSVPPVQPVQPVRPIKLGPSGLGVRVITGLPEGQCGCLVDSLRFKYLKPNGCYTRSGVNIASGW